jgi:hypothetical protein
MITSGQRGTHMSIEKAELFKHSTENLEWFKDNYKTLMKKYNNQWIVIQNKKIIATGSKYEKTVSILKHIDKKSAIVEFIDSKQLAMFF